MHWVYEVTGGSYHLIAQLGSTDRVEVSPNRTNGWRDIICHFAKGAGVKSDKSVYRFDGRFYVGQ